MTEIRLPPRVRRIILEQLPRDRMAEFTATLALQVEDRRSTDSLVDAIVRKRSLDFARALIAPRRADLLAACEDLGLELRPDNPGFVPKKYTAKDGDIRAVAEFLEVVG